MANDIRLHSTFNAAVEHSIVPLIEGLENHFDIEYLADSLIERHYDGNGHLLGFAFRDIADEEFTAIFKRASEIAGW